ncbi:hypothetical protein Pcinc_034835 [Petrolisthes cinctipes]|uniref:Uncharacterized protein n=1 Tax=Petrolisthes cinctipes TaxID=88211 RepID=A0AAE1BXR6_PETCI|nr:hypothetical protein Pcinc_034835 [Petrolisthes cinctipes]
MVGSLRDHSGEDQHIPSPFTGNSHTTTTQPVGVLSTPLPGPADPLRRVRAPTLSPPTSTYLFSHQTHPLPHTLPQTSSTCSILPPVLLITDLPASLSHLLSISSTGTHSAPSTTLLSPF